MVIVVSPSTRSAGPDDSTATIPRNPSSGQVPRRRRSVMPNPTSMATAAMPTYPASSWGAAVNRSLIEVNRSPPSHVCSRGTTQPARSTTV